MICKFCKQEFEAAQQGYCPVCGAAYVVGEPVELARAQLIALVHGGYYDPEEPEVWQLQIDVAYVENKLVVFGWNPEETLNTEICGKCLGRSARSARYLIKTGRLPGALRPSPADGRSKRGKSYRIPRLAITRYRMGNSTE